MTYSKVLLEAEQLAEWFKSRKGSRSEKYQLLEANWSIKVELSILPNKLMYYALIEQNLNYALMGDC